MLNLKKSIFLMVCLMAAVVTNAASWTGSTSEPDTRKVSGKVFYAISNANELAWFSNQVNSGNTEINAILVNDISFYDGTVSSSAHCEKNFPTIGSSEVNAFKGIFDGNGFSIGGLFYEGTKPFGVIFQFISEGAQVKNFSIVNSYIYANLRNESSSGVLFYSNAGLVEHVTIKRDVIIKALSERCAGCLGTHFDALGYINQAKGSLRFVRNESNIIADVASGMVSFNYGLIEKSENAGNVTAGNGASGLAHDNASTGVIRLCMNSGRISGSWNGTRFVGGNAGIMERNINTGIINVDRTGGYDKAVFVYENKEGAILSNNLNLGNTTGGSDRRGIVFQNKGTVKNNFYLTTSTQKVAGPESLINTQTNVDGANYTEMAWSLNTTNGTEENSGIWTVVEEMYNGFPMLITDSTNYAPIVKVVFNDDGARTIRYTDYSGTVVIPSEPKPEEGMVFVAWVDAAGRAVRMGTIFTKDVTVNAVYKSASTLTNVVTFLDENDEELFVYVTDESGKLSSLPEAPDPEPEEGMVFVAWVDKSNRAVKSSSVFSQDVTVNAVYKSASTLTNVVTFLDENDEELFAYVTDESGKLSSLPEAPAPAEGYYFKGWFTEDFIRVNETTVFKANATLKALYGELSDVSYTITFKNADGTVLQTKTVKHGSIPEYTGVAPALEATAQYSYTFAAWDAAIVPATDDVVYTATYNATINSYTISFVDFDDSEIWSNVQPYGSSVVFGGVIPTRETTVAYSYTFKSWDKAVSNVTANATYKAVYDSTAITYEVVFKNGSVVLSTQQVEYGKAATAPASPTREGYLFSGWDKSFSKVTTNLVVNALFDLAPTHQLIVYVDGEVVIETAPAEGSEYTLPPAADKNGHTFLGWYDAEGNKLGDAGDKITIVDDITITAKYEINKYTITFMFGSTKLQSSQVEYNKMPTYDGVEPSREKTAAYTYTFAGWSPVVSATTKDQVYNAVFDSTLNKFIIVFMSAEGILQTKSVGYGATPVYTGEAPAKNSTAQYEYSFAGWDPEITSVTVAKTYTAVFDSTLRAYKVTFKVGGETVQSKSVFYGSTPVYTGDEPAKTKSENYTYEFAGWTPEIKSVTGAQTYTAVFDSTKIAKPASSSSVPSSSSSSGKGESSSSNKGSSSSGDKDALTIVKAAPQFSVEVQGRTLQIAGAKSGAVYSLMDMQGRLLKQGTADANFSIEVPRAGTYLIRINKSISRATVR